ncbi:MAG: 3-oxoacyl-ACP synthase [Chitinophagales bacterium]|nr:MAG: 3-oxoacyl-ACP synthase [Chitinophagales bacterium]
MFILRSSAISPQRTFVQPDLQTLVEYSHNKLTAIEPPYTHIPLSLLRRMGKTARIGVGAALPLATEITSIQGILVGTAMGGFEDSIKFLNQIVDYQEGTLTPVNFVQSTPNAVSSHIGMLTKNLCYNITHIHGGLAFENALLDTLMLLQENPAGRFLVGAADSISEHDYNLDVYRGWTRREPVSNKNLFINPSPGTLAGEGAAFFIMQSTPVNALAALQTLTFFESSQAAVCREKITQFLHRNTPPEGFDLLLSGEDGDSRHLIYYDTCEQAMGNIPVARFKHLCGEYPTASSFGLWLGIYILHNQHVPPVTIKRGDPAGKIRHILMYNSYRGRQHSLLVLSSV